ncbi:Uncharacterised protein [Vibrio cholerae]|nr:Uncharacterised protein [Vibrio cholerae]CSC67210.1 Uncharacterised protein [Vibrio cholerae]
MAARAKIDGDVCHPFFPFHPRMANGALLSMYGLPKLRTSKFHIGTQIEAAGDATYNCTNIKFRDGGIRVSGSDR